MRARVGKREAGNVQWRNTEAAVSHFPFPAQFGACRTPTTWYSVSPKHDVGTFFF
jgi:hypothetical protein